MSIKSFLSILRQLWRQLSGRRKVQFILLLLLMVFTSITEIISIGAIMPFLSVLTNPDLVLNYQLIKPLYTSLGITNSAELLLPLTVMFSVAALISGGSRLLLLWASIRLTYSTGADFSSSIYKRTLYQPYEVHIARNSSEIIASISTKVGVVIFSLMQALNLVSSSILLTAIIFTLLVISPFVAATAMAGFLCIYLFFALVTQRRSKKNSYRISQNSSKTIKALQEGLGGIREILIEGSQEVFFRFYQKADTSLRLAQSSNSFISSSPRTIVEAISMVLLATIAFIMSKNPNGLENAIPVLGAIVLGAQRMLPAMQQVYSGWTSLRGEQDSIKDVLDLLNQPISKHISVNDQSQLEFKNRIVLKEVSFRYSNRSPWVFNNIDLTIHKGDKIGFIGTTGSGKSTLIDILMSLLKPTLGQLMIDDLTITSSNQRAWQSKIAHVPQGIFLTDGSILENIAFGISHDKINLDRVYTAAKQAQIFELIQALPQGFNTLVGERGIRISGGQRQRIGIARALYKNAEIIILDEATSALDSETEKTLMQSIDMIDSAITILIVAHRITTLKNCSKIIEIGGGGIKRICNYEEALESQ
jgi:ABC-type multidrug transport system fused ATPase/permease subunit